MRRLRGRLTYANVMATFAVFIALGGTSYAVSKLPKNSVGTKQLKKNAVTTAKIADQAITAAKIQNGVLPGGQITASTIGTVPNATHAASADNADTLDGQSASDFAPESEVQTPARMVLDDPNPNDLEGLQTPDLIAGSFKLTGHCIQNQSGESEFASVILHNDSVENFRVSGFRGGLSFGGIAVQDFLVDEVLYAGTFPARRFEVTAVAPNGDVVQITGTIEVNVLAPNGDCAFAFTVTGP